MLLAILLGIFFGVFSGLTPGVHVNLVCTLLLGAFPFLPFSQIDAFVFIIAMAITHTFLDIIPTVFLGVPDDATALGVLPAHRYVLAGQGLMAVKLSTIGALGGLLLGLVAYPGFIVLTKLLDTVPKHTLGIILLCLPIIMWIRERKKIAAGAIIVLTSLYGWIGFRFTNPLFPMLSGLFGAATLLYSIQETNKLPEQKLLSHTTLRWKDVIRASLGGLLAGGLTAVLPGVGAAHASVFGMLLAKGTGDHGFLVLTGVIGTTNFFLSLAAYDAIGKARNGALLAATTVQPGNASLHAIAASLIAAAIGVPLTLLLSKYAAAIIPKVPYRLLTVAVLTFVSILIVALSGWIGVLIYVTGAAIGLLPAVTKAARAHAMSCILVPIGLRFLIG